MYIAIFALIAWIIIVVFILVPKRLTITEMIFLYFIIGIQTVTLFTLLDVSLQWVPVTRDVEKSLALHICRFIIIPLLLILAAGILNSPLRFKWRWGIGVSILMLLLVDDWLMRHFEMIIFRHWNYLYALIMYAVFIGALTLISRWFIRLGRGGLKQT
ncbi:hypothetical protein EKG37_07465 [Robertmurraya yapensis]|uniref:Uncharacterized protein n=1 Tax=Bacillus yapensis TaxID=2492960 RepID=A0A3S0KTG7_9BACI|nr:hypothetical protein [Bacillus yapensis]RTR34040.1 hypothetical protein EKG37_07465 [Bacillus yapensis]TKS97358.1 hypothetical protein FAR12_07465 [Bacillus yapensis]